MMSAISIRGLTKRYGAQLAVDDLSSTSRPAGWSAFWDRTALASRPRDTEDGIESVRQRHLPART